jgi:hypothetical protein
MLASRQTLKEINQLNRRIWRKQPESLTDGWLIALFDRPHFRESRPDDIFGKDRSLRRKARLRPLSQYVSTTPPTKRSNNSTAGAMKFYDCATAPSPVNEFLPISMPITATALLRFWDMACSLSLEPLARFVTGGAGARPDHSITGSHTRTQSVVLARAIARC